MSYIPGTKVGKLLVETHPFRVGTHTLVLCTCECGKSLNVEESLLLKQPPISDCGCTAQETIPALLEKHNDNQRKRAERLYAGYECGKYIVLSAERVKIKGVFYVEAKCRGCDEVKLVREHYLKYRMIAACRKCRAR